MPVIFFTLISSVFMIRATCFKNKYTTAIKKFS